LLLPSAAELRQSAGSRLVIELAVTNVKRCSSSETGQYALRSVTLLRRIPLIDCAIRDCLQLPEQPVLVQKQL
jgi:hypothetical protein